MFAKVAVKRLTISAALMMSLLVSACGTTEGDRAVSGGLIGAGTGAIIGSLAGSAGTGALVGGLGGAAIGALTSPNAINLGKPAWRQGQANHNTRVAHRKCVRWSSSTGKCTRTVRT